MAETSVGGVSWVVDADVSPAVNSTKQLDIAVDKVETNLKGLDTQVSKTAKGVNKSMSMFGRTAGQAGMQWQQFIGQIQAGTPWLTAASQQGADLGFVLGVPLMGAIVGIAASLTSMLIPGLDATNVASEELEETLKTLSATVKTNGDGINVLTNEYAALAKKSEDLARTQLLLAKVNADQVLGQAAEAAKDAVYEFDTFFNAVKQGATGGTFNILDETLKRTDKTVIDLLENTDLYATGLTQLKSAVEQVNEEFGTTTDESVRILRQFSKFKESGTVEAFDQLSTTMLSVADASRGKVTPEFVKLTNEISTLAFQSKTAQEQAQFLEKALDGLNVATEESVKQTEALVDARDKLTAGLALQVATIGMTAREVDHYKASLIGADQSVHDMIDTVHNHKDALIAQKQAVKDNAKAQKEAAKEQSELNKKGFEEQVAIQKEMDRLRKEQADSKKDATKIADTYGDPVAALKAQKDAEYEILRQAEEKGIKLHTDYSTLRSEIDKKYDEQRLAAMEAKFVAESEWNALAISGIDALGQASESVLMGMINGTMTAKDAMLAFSNAILKEAVGALVQIGVQYVKNAIIAQTATQSQMAAEQAVKAANAAAHTTAVAAQVAELTALGTAGAIAATAAIPIVGPALAPAAGAAIGGLVAAAGAGAIAAAPIAGMRHDGGSVLGGKTYEVGEKNKPEMLMIPGNNGKVFSNAEMKGMMGGGGDGGYKPPTINNYAAGVSVQHSRDSVTKADVFDIIDASSMNPNSKMRRNMTSGTNTQNQIRGGR